MQLTLFPMGGNRMIAWDYAGPDVEDEEMREIIRVKRHTALHFWKYLPSGLKRRHPKRDESSASSDETEKPYQDKNTPITPEFDEESAYEIRRHTATPSAANDYHEDGMTVTAVPSEAVLNSRICSSAPTEVLRSHATSPVPSVTHADTVTHVDHHPNTEGKNVRFDEATTSSLLGNLSTRRRMKRRAINFLVSLSSPPSLSIIISFPIALITPLKGLFVELPNSPIPNAPDGQPPLAFIMDTATFVGAASVPMGLVCLGSALARLKVPMNRASWKAMPVGAIGALALAKIAISPVLGVLICEGLTNVGVIDRNDKVLRFVCMYADLLFTFLFASDLSSAASFHVYRLRPVRYVAYVVLIDSMLIRSL